MMFTFIKALGGEVGDSLVEDDLLQLARDTSDKAEANNVKLDIGPKAGHWSLVTGHWSLVTGHWSLVGSGIFSVRDKFL